MRRLDSSDTQLESDRASDALDHDMARSAVRWYGLGSEEEERGGEDVG